MSKTFQQKRLLELAGLKDTKPRPSKINLQESYGNAYIQSLILEEEEKEEKEDGAEKEESTEKEEDDGDIGEEGDPSLSDSDLAKGLKDGAQAMADAVPSKSNEDFANIVNAVKDAAEDPQKIKKIADFIGKL
tara:strand:+ start:2788 stop:3186 length:399 start_codon:yes stop_codon:yes gene_type:complete